MPGAHHGFDTSWKFLEAAMPNAELSESVAGASSKEIIKKHIQEDDSIWGLNGLNQET